jgi:hypothetical protein
MPLELPVAIVAAKMLSPSTTTLLRPRRSNA